MTRKDSERIEEIINELDAIAERVNKEERDCIEDAIDQLQNSMLPVPPKP